MKNEKCILIGLIVVACLSLSFPALAEIRYTITDLGTLGGSLSEAHAINNSGQIVGLSYISDNSATHAFLYDGTQMRDIGLSQIFCHATSINSSGQIAGYNTVDPYGNHAFLYDGTAMKDLGTLGGGYSCVMSINDSGLMAGSSSLNNDDITHAIVYDTSMHDIGTLGGNNSQAYGINNSGIVVGESYIAGNSAKHAFLYDGTAMNDLGTLGGNDSFAWAINSTGQIIGQSDIIGDSESHAFFYDGTAMQDLGTLGGNESFAFGINNNDQIVGYSSALIYHEAPPFLDKYELHAFLYEGNNMIDLNTLLPAGNGWVLKVANAINDSGQIVGYGRINHEDRAFLLTPVPEPATLLLFGLVVVILRRKC